MLAQAKRAGVEKRSVQGRAIGKEKTEQQWPFRPGNLEHAQKGNGQAADPCEIRTPNRVTR